MTIPASSLLWSDEFRGAAGSAVDSAKWKFQTGRFYNKELETYLSGTANAAQDGNGNLVITARKTSSGYTSARLNSRYVFTFGYLEARILLPSGQGYWPAFWLMGSNSTEYGGTVDWPACGEIDIMEAINDCRSCYQTIHGGSSESTHWQYELPSTPIPAGWHTFGVDKQAGSLTFYVDGVKRGSVVPSQVKSWPFNVPNYILLNLAVGGDWPRNPTSSTVFPQSMAVDYVRLYSSVTPAPSGDRRL